MTYSKRGSFSEGDTRMGALGVGGLGEVFRFLEEAVQGQTLFAEA
jgi:hypothetical protein